MLRFPGVKIVQALAPLFGISEACVQLEGYEPVPALLNPGSGIVEIL